MHTENEYHRGEIFLSMRAKAPEANRGGETWNHSK